MQDLKSFKEFLKNINRDFEDNRIYRNDIYIYYLPEGCVLDKSVHYIRTGLLLGRMNKDRFEPSQAFAMELKADDWKNPLILNHDDERVMRYLKGETIDADDEAEGYRLICIDSHPLGWVKQSGNRCKNKYYAGWRYS